MGNLLSGINLALQALRSQQSIIDVTQHNVANANTAGYRRQEAILSSGPEYPPLSLYGSVFAGQVGTGVLVNEIKRFNLDFFDNRLRQETSESQYWSVKHDALSQVEATLAETSQDGLSAKLDNFWSGWTAVSGDPTNLSARSELYSRAVSLTNGLNARVGRLKEIQQSLDGSIVENVHEVNELARKIAGLNAEISAVKASGNQPNDLLDERDRALDRLSDLTGATASVQNDGGALVSVGGHVLVVGNQTFSLITRPDGNHNLNKIYWEQDGSDFTPGTGEISARLETRDGKIEDQLTGLDNIAGALINTINPLHRAGFGLKNDTGNDFFTGTDASTIGVNSVLADPEKIALSGAMDSPGDNSVAESIIGVQDQGLLGSQTISQFTAGLASGLGSDIQDASNNADARKLVADSLIAQRDAVSGVSLDEEAANLVKAQRAYEAASRIVNVLDDMANKIINGMGRVGL
jgi:flagellar hook-associated protein 1 FlgK